MDGLVLSPPSQALVDYVLKFAGDYPKTMVEVQPIAAGGSHEVWLDLLPLEKKACNLSLKIKDGRAEASFGSNERMSALVGKSVFLAGAKTDNFVLDMRRDYKALDKLLHALANGRLKPHSAVWFGRFLEPLGAYVELDGVSVYVGETQGIVRGILALFRVVRFGDAQFAVWE